MQRADRVAIREEVTWGGFRAAVEFQRRRRLPPLRLVTSAHAFVFDGNRLVLTYLSDRSGRHVGWDVPGGRREAGETPVAALRRKCLEEAGVTLSDIELLGAIKVTARGATPPPGHPYPWPVSYLAIYVARAVGYQEVSPDHEAIGRGLFEMPEAVRLLRDEKGDSFLAQVAEVAWANTGVGAVP